MAYESENWPIIALGHAIRFYRHKFSGVELMAFISISYTLMGKLGPFLAFWNLSWYIVKHARDELKPPPLHTTQTQKIRK